MIDSKLGLTADFGAPPNAVTLEVAFNEKSNPPQNPPVDKTLVSTIFGPTPLRDDYGLQQENGLSSVAGTCC